MDSDQDRKRQRLEVGGVEAGGSQAGGKAKVDLHGVVDRKVLSAFLQREYGLGLVDEENSLKKLYGGYSGSNYRAKVTGTGSSGKEIFVLVKVQKGEEQVSELEAQGQLLSGPLSSFPFSSSPRELLVASGGRRYTACMDDMLVLVLDYLEGTTADEAINSKLSSPLAAMYQVGLGLATLHAMPGPPSARTETSGGAGTCAKTIAAAVGPGGELSGVASSESDAAFLALLRQRLPSLLRIMRIADGGASGADHDAAVALPVALLHGDAFLDNVIFGHDAVLKGFVDWEDAAVGPRLVDLACAIIGCCYHRGSALCDYQWLAALLQGYQEKVYLEEEEIELLTEAMQGALLCNAFFRFRQFNVRFSSLGGASELANSHQELVDRLLLLDGEQHQQAITSACRARLAPDFVQQHWTFPPDTHYFDGAGRGPLPLPSQHAANEAVAACAFPASLPSAGATVSRIRELFVGLLGVGTASSVAVTPSTSYAMSLVAKNIVLSPGKDVVVLESQSGSNVLMWQALVKRTASSSLRVIPRPPDLDWTPRLLAAIDAGVGVVALGNVHWTDASYIDLPVVSDKCRADGVALCLDLTQSLGAMPFDGVRVQPSFVACSTHKWIHSIHGVSLLYVAPEWSDRVHSMEEHDRNRLGSDQPHWDDVGAMTLQGYPTEFMPGAQKLDSGGRPNPVLMPALLKSLEMVTSLGPALVEACCAPRILLIADCARALGYAVPTRHAPQFVGLRIMPDHKAPGERTAVWRDLVRAQVDPAQVHAGLLKRGFKLSLRCGAIRVSVYLYTKMEDITALCSALVEVTHALAPPPA